MDTNKQRAGFIVNAPGLQVRRANSLRDELESRLDVDVLVAPSLWEVVRSLHRWDLVYVIDAGRQGFRAAALGRMAGRPTIVELGDPQGALYATQGRGRVAAGVGQVLDRVVTLGASGVVVRGRELARILDVRVPWITVPDGADLKHCRAGLGADVRTNLGFAEGDLVLGLVGSLVWSSARRFCYGMEIVEALGLLRGTDVRGLIVGDGTGTEYIRRRAAELGVSDRIVLAGRVEHSVVPSYIGAMDVCVSTQSNDAVGRGRTTAKLPEYLACDRYVLSTSVPSAVEVLPAEMIIDCDGDLGPLYAATLADRVRVLLDRQPALRQSGGTRRIAEKEFDYRLLADRLYAFFDARSPTRPERDTSRMTRSARSTRRG